MTNVMTSAWEIRRTAATKWDCGMMDILFDLCLKMAHKGEKIMNETIKKIELTHTELIEKAKRYDNLHNEGGEGYNPYSAELERRQFEYEKNLGKSPEEKKLAILKEIEVLDCSIARESGTYDAEKIADLRAQVKDIEAEQDAIFLETWTLEITKARRIEWNDFARGTMGNNRKVNHEIAQALTEKQREQGWWMDDLRKAVKLHNL